MASKLTYKLLKAINTAIVYPAGSIKFFSGRLILDLSPAIKTLSNYNGQAYTPSGVLTEGLTDSSKPWVKYDLSTGAITEEVGPPSEAWGTSEDWRKKSDFTGAIYF